LDQAATGAADISAPEAGKSRPRRNGPTWRAIFVGGLALWVATVLVTFVTQNSNLIPTIILLGSFLFPSPS
jgi:protease PrsW